VQDKTEATIMKLNLLVQPYRERKIHFFHTLSDFIDFSEQPLSSDVAESMIEHTRSLASQLRPYFSLCPEKEDWMKTLFLDSEYEPPSVEGEQLSSSPVIQRSK
jgi:hypothetical protein